MVPFALLSLALVGARLSVMSSRFLLLRALLSCRVELRRRLRVIFELRTRVEHILALALACGICIGRKPRRCFAEEISVGHFALENALQVDRLKEQIIYRWLWRLGHGLRVSELQAIAHELEEFRFRDGATVIHVQYNHVLVCEILEGEADVHHTALEFISRQSLFVVHIFEDALNLGHAHRQTPRFLYDLLANALLLLEKVCVGDLIFRQA